jgi:hypothetical protein
MLALSPDDPAAAHGLQYWPGPAVLIWPHDAAQPSAFVATRRGAGTVLLRDAPDILRAVIASGRYCAKWVVGGTVVITRIRDGITERHS